MLGVQGWSRIQGKFQSSVIYILRPCLKDNIIAQHTEKVNLVRFPGSCLGRMLSLEGQERAEYVIIPRALSWTCALCQGEVNTA